MSYAENTSKFTAVLNMKVPFPRLANALGHATAGLAAELGQSAVRYLDYFNDAEGFRSKIAESPFIILQARNSSQLSRLCTEAMNAQIPHNAFVSAMVGGSAAEQVQQTRIANGANLEYWALVLFGEAQRIDPLTRKFSLYAANALPGGV